MARNSPQHSAGEKIRDATPERLFEVEPLPEPAVTTIAETQHGKIVRAIDMPRRDLADWEIDDTVKRPHAGLYGVAKISK